MSAFFPKFTLARATAFSVICALFVTVLPPPVTMRRNPPPEPLVLMVWMRFYTALALLTFNACFLIRFKNDHNPYKVILYISSTVAIFCGVRVVTWVLEFPVAFTWRVISTHYFGN